MRTRLRFVLCVVLAGAARAFVQTYHEASWSADAAGDLIADPMPDYSALLAQNVSGMQLETHNTTLCYVGGSPRYAWFNVESNEQCFAKFEKPHEWNQGTHQKILVSDEEVAQEYFLQGSLEHTRGNLFYVAQWEEPEKLCTIRLARGCPFSEGVCQDSIRNKDKCLKELPNMHVTQAANATLFNLQTPCANQYKLPSWYAERSEVHSYMTNFYNKAWNDYPASRPAGVPEKPNQVAQIPPPKYTKQGNGFCNVERAYKNVWSNLSSFHPRGECPMAIRKALITSPHSNKIFVGGWPFGGDLPVAWLDGWPLVWAFEQTDAGGKCHWLNLQNVTRATVLKLVNETECNSLNSSWLTANITVYEKDVQAGSVEHNRLFNVGNKTDHDIQIRCPPGQYASGSSWTDFANGAQVCEQCPLYTYKNTEGASGRCNPCPIGLGIAVTGSTSDEVCTTLRSDEYKWGSDEEPSAIPIHDAPSAFMNWREELSRMQQLCGETSGCRFEDVIREARCALIKEDNARYKETSGLAQVQVDIRVNDAANRRLGVFIPENALVADTNISVSVAPEPTQTDDLALDDDGVLKFVGTRITYEPHGLQFAAPVTLYLHAIPGLVPFGTVPKVYYLNTSGANVAWEPMPGSVYNPATGEISVQSQHFSSYATVVNTSSVAASSTPQPAPEQTNASSTPQPAPGQTNTSSTPEPTKSKGLAPGAIVAIVFAGLFLFVACVVYISCIRQPASSQASQETKSPGNTRIDGARSYYEPVKYDYGTYAV